MLAKKKNPYSKCNRLVGYGNITHVLRKGRILVRSTQEDLVKFMAYWRGKQIYKNKIRQESQVKALKAAKKDLPRAKEAIAFTTNTSVVDTCQ